VTNTCQAPFDALAQKKRSLKRAAVALNLVLELLHFYNMTSEHRIILRSSTFCLYARACMAARLRGNSPGKTRSRQAAWRAALAADALAQNAQCSACSTAAPGVVVKHGASAL